MTRITSILLCTFLIFNLYSCTKNSSTSSTNTKNASTVLDGTTTPLNGFGIVYKVDSSVHTMNIINTDASSFFTFSTAKNSVNIFLSSDAPFKIGTYKGTSCYVGLTINGKGYSSSYNPTDSVVISSLTSTAITGTYSASVLDSLDKKHNVTGNFSGTIQ